MNHVIIDIIDDLKCISLTEKGWNYVATALLIGAGFLWGSICDYGDLCKIIGCVSYIAAAALWATKSGWGKWLMENMFDDSDMVPFED